MAIIRYTASADNTISNAFDESIVGTNRATGSNMGKADVLEVFSIYGQDSGSSGPSSELSRILIKFDTTAIAADRTATTIPASGSVNFYLKMYNTPHSSTTPEDYKLTVARVTSDWEEGYGLDMDNYEDKTYDGIGSNWERANGTDAKATATLTLSGMPADDGSNLATMHGQKFTLTDVDGTPQEFTFDLTSTTLTGGTIGFGLGHGGGGGISNTSDTATAILKIKTAINNISALDIDATTITQAGDASSKQTLLLTQGTVGYAGNTEVDTTNVTGLGVDGYSSIAAGSFTNGSGKWSSFGGDFTTATSNDFVDATFTEATGNLEVDITALVEEWIKGGGGGSSTANYGMMIKLSSSYEAYFSSSAGTSTSTATHNVDGAKRSYYTKKFFGRGTEYFFKRPVIEARWDDSRKDDRDNFYLSSSATPAASNTNTLYLYNYVRGKLEDHPQCGSTCITSPHVLFFASSGSVPEYAHALDTVTDANCDGQSLVPRSYENATRVSKGIYKICFQMAPNQAPSEMPYVVDVWYMGGTKSRNVDPAAEVLHIGTPILPKNHGFSQTNPNSNYVLSIPNMRKWYNNAETARFRVHCRQKDWSPTVYTVAKNNVEMTIVPSASYEIYRVIDEAVVVPYGTGSTPSHTMLSYDVSGSYFDFDMSMLEAGYSYAIRISIYEDSIGSWREQPYSFKFRVDKHEY